MMRFRKSDLFAVLGVILLLVWIPGYAGQGETERELASGHAFTLPPPRDGDVVEFTMVYQKDGEQAYALGPIARMQRHAVDPENDPNGAVMLEEWTFFAKNATIGPFRYTANDLVMRLSYLADGRIVQEEKIGWEWWNGARHSITPGSPSMSTYQAEAVEAVRFVPDTPRAWLYKNAQAYGIVPTGAALEITNTIGLSGGTKLYGTVSEGLDDMLSRFDEAEEVWVKEEGERYHFFDIREIERYSALTFKEPVRLTATDNDHRIWHHPDMAGPVGVHRQHRLADGGAFTVDIVPNRLIPGDGVALDVERLHHSHFYGQPHDPRPPRPFASEVRTIDLETFQRYDRPLLRGLTLQDVHADLERADAPKAVQEAQERGAQVVGIAWDDGASYTIGEDPRLPVLPMETVEPRVYHSFWDVLLRDASGRHTIVAIHFMEHHPDRQIDAEVAAERCPVPESRKVENQVDWHWCPAEDAPLFDDTRRFLHIDGVFADILERDPRIRPQTQPYGFDWPARPERFHYFPTQWQDRHHYAMTGIGGWVHDETDTDGVERGTRGIYRLDDGRLWEFSASVPAGDMRYHEHVPPSTATTSSAVATPDILPATLGLTGLVLLFFAALVRGFGWLKAGGQTAFFAVLFSRIHKDDALAHARRAEIVALLENDPGLTMTEIARRLGYGRGATLHHLGTLKRNGLLVDQPVGRKRHWFSPVTPKAERVRHALLSDPNAATLYEAVQESPGMTLEELTERMPHDKSGASRLGTRLAAEGLLRKEKEGRTVRYYLAGPTETRPER